MLFCHPWVLGMTCLLSGDLQNHCLIIFVILKLNNLNIEHSRGPHACWLHPCSSAARGKEPGSLEAASQLSLHLPPLPSSPHNSRLSRHKEAACRKSETHTSWFVRKRDGFPLRRQKWDGDGGRERTLWAPLLERTSPTYNPLPPFSRHPVPCISQ